MEAFWVVTPWFPHWGNWKPFWSGYEFSNAAEILPLLPAAGEFAAAVLPALRVEFSVEDFGDDCFLLGRFMFVSEKMRRVIALGPADIQYFDVDSSQSAPLPRSKRYQLMHVPVAEDVTDPDRSDYKFRHRPEGDELWGAPRAVAFRPDAEPVHEIFYDRFFNIALCTDEFALRVLWSGCTGMRFLDPAQLNGSGSCYRTLRGVEKSDEWDPVRKVSYTKLIREIP
jgi:hypothetical protein